MSENKMNRIYFAICLLVMSVCIIGGCTPAFYRGDNPEYYKMISANTLYITREGFHSTSKELEKDEYGRTLFLLQIKNSYDIYGICQYNGSGSCGYYEDYCYYVFDFGHVLKDDDLNDLKSRNDWSMPLDWDKITTVDHTNDYDMSSSLNAFRTYNGFNNMRGGNWLPKFRNSKGDWIYIASVLDGNEYKTYIVLFDASQKNIIDQAVINDTVNCQDELHEFKEKNNWFGGKTKFD